MPRRLFITAILMLVFLSLVSTVPVSRAASQWNYTWTAECNITIVAVSSGGGGVTSNLTVRVAYPGTGKVYISTSPASMIDTQGSARLAAFAASLLAGVDMTRYDFFYDIESNSVIIGGPSAGFAMSLATLLALTGYQCPDYLAVTGMIQPDTSIGPVGGLKEKLEAAASAGKTVFMIPAGQEVYTYYRTVYKRIGPFIYTTREPVTVNLTQLGEQLGVQVIPVASLGQAFELITGRNLTPAGFNVPGVDEYIRERLVEYVNITYEKITNIINSVSPTTRYTEQLLSQIQELANHSLAQLENAPYSSAIEITNALSNAYALQNIETALQNNLEITSTVNETNNTINQVYNTISNLTPANPESLENLAKAWAKLGIASYYYQKALETAENDQGRYYLPHSFFTADPTPAILLADARATAEWAQFWASLAESANNNSSIDWPRVERLSRLLLAEARTTLAYVTVLIQEAGATADTGMAENLVEQAMLAGNSVARIGYSIEAIAVSNSIIHDTFTIDVLQTNRNLMRTALTLYKRAGNLSTQVPLLLELAQTNMTNRTGLLAASKAVLYAWLIWDLTVSSPNNTLVQNHSAQPSQVITPRESNAGSNTVSTRSGGESLTEKDLMFIELGMVVATLALIAVTLIVRRSGQ